MLNYAPYNQYAFQRCYDFHVGGGGTFGDTHVSCTFSTTTPGDNGDLYQAINNLDSNRTQNFAYDSLNRITQAYTNGPNWGEAFTIDAWGNLTNKGQIPGNTKNLSEMLNCAIPAGSTSNQLSTCFNYDSAGNTLNDPFNNQYTYDDENRIVKVTNSGTAWTYVYDGDGKRLIKCTGTYPTCSSGTLYWTGVGSAALAESDLSGNLTAEYFFFQGNRAARKDLPSGTVHDYFSDPLGTARTVVTAINSSGYSVDEDADYFPYGGEIVVQGSSTATHYKFTGKERDTESGLDNFGASYNA